jgi:tRNA (guanine37-N1)-methyltransferase
MLMLPGPLGRGHGGRGLPGKADGFRDPRRPNFQPSVRSDLATEPELVLLCGRYEGVDQRIVDKYVTDEISIGTMCFLPGGGGVVVVDAVYRLIDGVITGESLTESASRVGFWNTPSIHAGHL